MQQHSESQLDKTNGQQATSPNGRNMSINMCAACVIFVDAAANQNSAMIQSLPLQSSKSSQSNMLLFYCNLRHTRFRGSQTQLFAKSIWRSTLEHVGLAIDCENHVLIVH